MENNTVNISLNELSLPVVSDCDLITAPEGFYHIDRIADFNVMIYVIEGVMYVTEEGQDYEISSGEMLFLRNGLRHFGRYETPRGTSWIYAHFRLAEIAGNSENDMLRLPKKQERLPRAVAMRILKRISSASATDLLRVRRLTTVWVA